MNISVQRITYQISFLNTCTVTNIIANTTLWVVNSIANIINYFTQNILQLYTYRNLGFLSPADCSSGPASEEASGTAAALEDLSGTGGTFEAFSGAGFS